MTAATLPAAPNAAAVPRTRKRRVPSERNRHVFVEVVIRVREQPEVAREFGITQQRVSQIIEQFYGWLAENVPPGTEGMSAQEQLRLAANVTYLRLEHAHAEAQRNFDESSLDTHKLKIRYSNQGKELWRETVHATHAPKCCFLNAALRACTEKWAVVRMANGLLSRGIEVVEQLVEKGERQAGMPAPARTPAQHGRPRKASESPTPPVKAGRMPPPTKVLCGSPPPSAAPALLASTTAAATSVPKPDCAPPARRKSNGSAAFAGDFKSCAIPPSRSRSRATSDAIGGNGSRTFTSSATLPLDVTPPLSAGKPSGRPVDYGQLALSRAPP